jgi:hypothetical protein
LLLSASPSLVGGNRGLWALRIPLEHLGARVFPDMFSLAQPHQAFDSEGRIANVQLSERFEENIQAFMDLVEAAKHYPCAKRAWFEFLGEQPSAATARFELHPQRAGTPYEVELSLLGSQATYDRLAEPAFQPIAPFSNTANATFFAQTSHKLSAGFIQRGDGHRLAPIDER